MDVQEARRGAEIRGGRTHVKVLVRFMIHTARSCRTTGMKRS
jgi:hypothetical protein